MGGAFGRPPDIYLYYTKLLLVCQANPHTLCGIIILFSGGGRHYESNQTADPQQLQGTEPGAAEQGCHEKSREDHQQ